MQGRVEPGRILLRAPAAGALLFALWTLLAATAARAQLPVPESIPVRADAPLVAQTYVVDYLDVLPLPADTAAAAAVLHGYVETLRRLPGFRQVVALQEQQRPDRFVLLQAWTDDDAFMAAGDNAATAAFQQRMVALLAAPVDERLLRPVSVGNAATGDQDTSGPGALYAITHVDTIGIDRDDVHAILNRCAAEARTQRGNLRYQVLRQDERGNHFSLIARWNDLAAFDAYTGSPSARALRQALARYLGSPYDERLYRGVQ